MVVTSLILSLFLYCITNIRCSYLEAAANYQKPTRERNNIVNKGVWIRNSYDDTPGRSQLNHFVFQENAPETDDLLHNNIFDTNTMQEGPFVSAYFERQKRSMNALQQKLEKIKDKSTESNENNDSDIARSKLVNEIRPSVFNDYPYEVAIFLNNNRSFFDHIKNKTTENKTNLSTKLDNITDVENKSNTNETSKTISQKRSMQYDFDSDVVKKIEYADDYNRTEEYPVQNGEKKIDRNVFDKDNTEWHQNVPIPDVNVYKVVPKEPVTKSKPVTERGLIKVISMLTKSFKKIMKQHAEIKEIHSKVSYVNDEFAKTVASITSKFQDFDLKYLYLVKLQEKLKDMEAKMAVKEEYFKNKEIEIDKGLKEFENQQKRFLQQQKQFFNIQKLMLAQNEKINIKQNLIAKTQGEISHRQNNFARILKKAKQLYIDSRNPAITKLSSSIAKIKEPARPHFESKVTHTSTQAPASTTGSIKINLFSIPTSNKVQLDPDEFILKEKDDQAIDDLVYKYYFNNTFIDSVMKNQILNSFLGGTENAGNSRISKTKRQGLATTLLLPISKGNETEIEHKRERRWTQHRHSHRNRKKHHKKIIFTGIDNATDVEPLTNQILNVTDMPKTNKNKRKNYKKVLPVIINATDVEKDKNGEGIPMNMSDKPIMESMNTPVVTTVKDDPFLIMARTFCNEIGQNINEKTLSWCIEKALRRLQFLEGKMTVSSTPLTRSEMSPKPKAYISEPPKRIEPTPNEDKSTTDVLKSTEHTTIKMAETTPMPPSVPTQPLITTENAYTNQPVVPKIKPEEVYFPDNDVLEKKLRQNDMKPDTEGNVYFDGSLHASDVLADSDSDGVDDIMPGLESNSRVEVDPVTFDLQAKRRAFVRKLNERIKMSLG